MRIIGIMLILLANQLFANYAFGDEKTVKIDMHGGNSEKMTNSNGFSDIKEKALGGFGLFNIKKPKEPIKPKEKKIPELDDIKLK